MDCYIARSSRGNASLPADSMPIKYEAPDVPSPRTAWSAYNRREISMWHTCHERLAADALAFTPASMPRPLVLFGDSITESWRGTSYGRRIARADGVQDELNATLGHYGPAPVALGIAADCTQHLLWRLQHGELTAAMAADPRLSVVLLIGTNNLGRGHTVAETVRGILACVEHLLNGTRGRLLVNGLLPRGDRRKKGRRKGRGFLHEIAAVNSALNASAWALAAARPGRLRFVDCGAPFLASTVVRGDNKAATEGITADATAASTSREEVVRRDLMPDRLHPNAAGHALWGRCLAQALAKDWK